MRKKPCCISRPSSIPSSVGMRPIPIIRSRTGCFTCRRRKKKCNEEKPICSGCKRNKLECHWPEPTVPSSSSQSRPAKASASSSTTAYTSVSTPAQSSKPSLSVSSANVPQQCLSSELDRSPAVRLSPVQHVDHLLYRTGPAPESDLNPGPSPEVEHIDAVSDLAASSLPSVIPTGCSSPSTTSHTADDDAEMADDEDLDDTIQPSPSPSTTASAASSSDILAVDAPSPGFDQDVADALTLTVTSGIPVDLNFSINDAIPMPISMLPQQGHNSYELLSYYLARTANSMGNGSTDVNPFIAKLIPLAFSKPLVLQLILAQSAAHRQASAERLPSDEIATQYYTDSLRMFRKLVNEYVFGNADNTLVLTVGSLIMCLTEVAKGDIHGTFFDHLTASKSLMTSLITRGSTNAYGDLPDFLVEYYMHMAASGMISLDAEYSIQSLISPDIEFLARSLLERKYVGQLCGCWLELLILIPQIFHLGQGMLSTMDSRPGLLSPDNIVKFGFLQSQVMGFFPDSSVTLYTRLAGLVFKQAVILYLWTIMGTPYQQPENSMHKALMDSAVADAITLLNQFPASARINTSLCWPLAVIGCCTIDPEVQQTLRDRLQTMLDTIGLGNMRQTLVLLEHVWRQSPETISPWTLCKSMRDHQIWISFA